MDLPAPEPFFKAIRSFPRSVWFLFLGSFLNKFGAFILPLLTFYMRGRGFSLGEVGFVLSAYGVGNLISAAGGGYLADMIGRRKTIILSMGLGALGMLALSQAESFTALLLLTFLVGLSGELYRPAASALLIDLVPKHQHAAAFATYRVAFNAGWMLGPPTAGFLVQYSYFIVFVGDALTSILFGLVAWFALPRGVKKHSTNTGILSGLRVLRKDRSYLLFLLALMGPGLLMMQTHGAYSAYLQDCGFSEKDYGIILAFNGFLILLFELPITAVTRRFPIRRVFAVGFFTIGAGFAMSGVSSNFWMLLVAMGLFTLGEMIAFPLVGVFVARHSPEDMRGRYMGANGCVWSLALIIGPKAGFLTYAASPAAYWIVCVVIGAIAAFIIGIDPDKKVRRS